MAGHPPPSKARKSVICTVGAKDALHSSSVSESDGGRVSKARLTGAFFDILIPESMYTIPVHQPNHDSLLGHFRSLYLALRGIDPNRDVTFNLEQVNFISPLLILPIGALIHEVGCDYQIPKDSNVATYLNTINFPHGFSDPDLINQDGSYIPIAMLEKSHPFEADKLENKFSRLLIDVIGDVPTISAIYYPVTEISTNIFEHSKHHQGWLFAQYYRSKKFLDICIVDRGRGLRRGYEEELGLKIDDLEALKKVVAGESIKRLDERGFGVYSSKELVTKGLGGQFFLCSGGAGLVADQDEERVFSIPEFNWQGVIVGMRIPKFTEPIDITPYLE